MRSRVDDWDTVARRLLLIPMLFVLYSGPAAVILVESIFDDEGFGANSLWDWALPIVVVWLFAVPFIVAYANWEDNKDTSAFSLGAFVGLIALFTLVGAPILKFATDLVLLPFTGVDAPASSDDPAFWIARICTFIILVGIPMVALIIQINRIRKQTPHGI